MGTDADAIPQETNDSNAYSFSKKTDTHATAFPISPAHTDTDGDGRADGNDAFPNSPANTDSDSEPYSEEANANAIPEKAYPDADWIIETELAKWENCGRIFWKH